jgi:rubrerythrin
MNPLMLILKTVSAGANAYLLSSQIRDVKTCPNVLAGFYLAESGSVPFLTQLRDRAAAEGEVWLAEKLTHHASDERRHGQIFANALKQLNKETIDFNAQASTDNTTAKERKSPFFETYYRGYAQTDLKPDVIEWPVFLGSTYVLEADACRDFQCMAQALEGVPNMEKIQAGILSVAADEERHASYLKEAILNRYGYFKVESMIDEWRTRKVDAILAMVWSTIEQGGKMRTITQDLKTDPAIVEREQALAMPFAA